VIISEKLIEYSFLKGRNELSDCHLTIPWCLRLNDLERTNREMCFSRIT